MQHTAEGEIKIIEIPVKQKPVVESLIPNNIGVVIKSTKILDFYPLLKELLELNNGGKDK